MKYSCSGLDYAPPHSCPPGTSECDHTWKGPLQMELVKKKSYWSRDFLEFWGGKFIMLADSCMADNTFFVGGTTPFEIPGV